MSEKTCFICLEEQPYNDNDIENNKLTEYNHCGKYYIHDKCLITWKSDECLICRNKINDRVSENSNNVTDIITILEERNNNNNNYYYRIKNRCVIVVLTNFIGVGILYMYTKIIGII